MKSVDGHDMDLSRGAGGGRGEREAVPGADVEDAERRQVEVREFEREKLGGDARTVERASTPGRREAARVIGMEVSQEVGLASLTPSVYRYHPSLHCRSVC